MLALISFFRAATEVNGAVMGRYGRVAQTAETAKGMRARYRARVWFNRASITGTFATRVGILREDLPRRPRFSNAQADELSETEPLGEGIRAINSPGTGIIDFGGVVSTLAAQRQGPEDSKGGLCISTP